MRPAEEGLLLLCCALGTQDVPLTPAQYRTLARRVRQTCQAGDGEVTPAYLRALGYPEAAALQITALLDRTDTLHRYLEAAAAQEMEQYRFGLIIGVMGHGNAFGPAGPGRFPQDAVAFAPAYGFFRRLFPPGQGRHVDVLPGKTAMAAHGFAPYQADFFIGRPADAVVDVAGRQGQPI